MEQAAVKEAHLIGSAPSLLRIISSLEVAMSQSRADMPPALRAVLRPLTQVNALFGQQSLQIGHAVIVGRCSSSNR